LKNNQCYFRDPFLTECILVNYSTFFHSWGWGCQSEEYGDFKDSTQNVINGFNYLKSPGYVFATNADCTNFYTKVDIPFDFGRYIIHWEVSIVAVEPKKTKDLNRKD